MIPNPHCSFCGRFRSEVERLIAGRDAFICNECVRQCADFLEASLESSAPFWHGPPHVLVRMPDGSVHGCEQESEWKEFVQDGTRFEWCATSGYVRGQVLLRVVAVRSSDEGGIPFGQAFSSDTKLTEDHARAALETRRSGP
jgi:hypothetical protein